MARISVLLPEPDSPPSSTRSPGLTLMSASSITTRPSRCTIDRSDDLDVGLAGVLDDDGRGARGIVVHLVERLVQFLDAPREADHSASRMKLSANQLSAVSTAVKAAAICMTEPSVSSPARYFGVASSTGKIGAKKALLLSIQVRWQCWRMTSSQRAATVGEGFVEPLALVVGALDQRDALGVLAHPRQLVAELRLGLVLGGDAIDQRTADEVGEHRDGGGVEHRRDGDVAGNPYAGAADVDRQRPADPEQDADERHRGQQGVDEADGELHHRLGGQAQVVGDAIFGIDLLLVGDRQPVVALLRQPARQQLARQPLPPLDLQRHAAPHHGDGERRADRHQHHDDR